jgi:predicted AlkP superfamily phosphohydrolase/phosphomutase
MRIDRGLRALCAIVILLAAGCSADRSTDHRVMVLGIDGMDPRLLESYLKEGVMPNFQEVIDRGDFKPLQTTMPPQSPVAWSTFITGTPPEKHGIFDFLHRDPKTMVPEFSMAKTEGSDWNLALGSWIVPLRSAKIEQLRKGRSFWEILDDRGVPTTIFRMPVNFPPAPAGRSLSGMGTPDILGTAGTFYFYTDEWFPDENAISGGRIFQVDVTDYSVNAQLVGPPNPYRREAGADAKGDEKGSNPDMLVDFRVDLDPENALAKVSLQDQEFILQQGEWSDWVTIRFEAVPHLVEVDAIARFYLQEVHPDFRLYVTPLQIDPAKPAMPITYPDSWAHELYQALGHFYTQELPEDTKAFSAGIFDGREFWEQSQFVYREQRRELDYALDHFDDGLLFFYFSSIDQGSHMLWRYSDPKHPAYLYDEVLSGALQTLYREMDEALGRVLEEIDDNTTLIVMSDHGFCPFYWEVNLNTWLAENGYVGLIPRDRRVGGPLFSDVDWSQTKVYALGLNGVYVNLKGREQNGIVSEGAEFTALLDQLEADLLQMKDPRNGQTAVSSVLRAGRDYPVNLGEKAPDLIVGYARGYRSSWQSPLGEFPDQVFLDNMDPWSGDHSVDAREVPGILVTNRQIVLENPALYDLTVTILDEFGVSKSPEMVGKDCLQ